MAYHPRRTAQRIEDTDGVVLIDCTRDHAHGGDKGVDHGGNVRLGRNDDGGVRGSENRVPPVGGRSWWLEQALAANPGEPCPPLAGETAADVCVVGELGFVVDGEVVHEDLPHVLFRRRRG